uniref:Starch synthase, chloroplastic/amyloplastic n=1 Tax=Mantoniella antarctica TaxID=81844 RepID=A0A7S0SDU2_9CHLO
MSVIPMYNHYDECGEPCARVSINVMGQAVDVDYFHVHRDGVDLVFVSHSCFYEVAGDIYQGGTMGVAWRGALLSQAGIEAVWHVPCGGVPFGDESLLYVANDWHTALLPVYLRAFYQEHMQLGYARSVLIVHNIAHQGRSAPDDVRRLGLPDHHTGAFYLDDPVGGPCMNIMKAGIEYATKVIAVSPSYAWEIQTDEGGWGLAPTLRNDPHKISGIVNGMDFNEWSPEHDTFLQSDGFQNYNTDLQGLWTGKQACKAALQRQLGLPEDPYACMIGFVGRLDEQKGIDLVLNSEEFLMNQHIQMVFLGTGRPDLQDKLYDMQQRNSDKVRAWIGFSNQTAHRITAASDIILMPSRYEPCGLNQLYAMHYGAVPVVHAVGGLRDTVRHFDGYNEGTGFTFERAEADKLQWSLGQALHCFHEHRDSFMQVALRGMHQDLGWDHAAYLYEQKLLEAKYAH